MSSIVWKMGDNIRMKKFFVKFCEERKKEEVKGNGLVDYCFIKLVLKSLVLDFKVYSLKFWRISIFDLSDFFEIFFAGNFDFMFVLFATFDDGLLPL